MSPLTRLLDRLAHRWGAEVLAAYPAKAGPSPSCREIDQLIRNTPTADLEAVLQSSIRKVA